MSFCWLWESWNAGLIWTAGLRAVAGLMPAYRVCPRSTNDLKRFLAWCPWILWPPKGWVEQDALESAIARFFYKVINKFGNPPEPSLHFEVGGHLLCEGAVGDVRRLQPLAQLWYSEDAFVSHPARILGLLGQKKMQRSGKDALPHQNGWISERSQTAFDPPPPFLETKIYCWFLGTIRRLSVSNICYICRGKFSISILGSEMTLELFLKIIRFGTEGHP